MAGACSRSLLCHLLAAVAGLACLPPLPTSLHLPTPPCRCGDSVVVTSRSEAGAQRAAELLREEVGTTVHVTGGGHMCGGGGLSAVSSQRAGRAGMCVASRAAVHLSSMGMV